jgi:hypothetical protein
MKKIHWVKMVFVLILMFVLIASPLGMQPTKAATTLSTGDIAFTGYNSDTPDQFAFVLLVGVDADTTITFTDNGWYSAGGFRATEGIGTLTFHSDYPAGVQITIQLDGQPVLVSSDGNNQDISWVDNGSQIALSASGDQMFAYQGTAPTVGNENNFLAAIQMNGDWDADATSSNTSARPSAFDTCCAFAIAPEVDNAVYTGSRNSTGDVDAVRSLVNNPVNWTTDDSSPVVIPNDSFTTPTVISLSNLSGTSQLFDPVILLPIGLVLLLGVGVLILHKRQTI